jgi:acyl-CoA thioesterase-2
MLPSLEALIANLDLEQIDENRFCGRSPRNGWKRVFGGQVIAQALVAASRTVEGKRPHSLHAYFMLGGDPAIPIIYEVERLRDGSSFTTRQVVARQNDQAIYAMGVSFHNPEPGFSHQLPMPDVPDPESLPSEFELAQLVPEPMREIWRSTRPIEMRPIGLGGLSREPRMPVQHIWFRMVGELPDDPAIHRYLLAYASDFSLLAVSMLPHGKTVFDPDLMVASLDHALWYHRDFRADDWLLYSLDSPAAAGGRAFCRGNIFNRDGLLVASATQEGLVRLRTR